MPYTAMIARLTTDYDSRTDLTAFKTFFVFCGNLAVSFAFYTLVMAAFIVSAVLMVSYPLSKQRHEEILAERGTS